MDDEPLHPISSEPWTYELERIDWRPSPAIAASQIDLTSRRGDERRLLRFLSPTEVEIGKGFCGQCFGLAITTSGVEVGTAFVSRSSTSSRIPASRSSLPTCSTWIAQRASDSWLSV
jgi:hypothetical protein